MEARPGILESMEELLVVDMGVVGDGVAGKGTAVSIAAKDLSGPYDYTMTSRLIELAEKHAYPTSWTCFRTTARTVRRHSGLDET